MCKVGFGMVVVVVVGCIVCVYALNTIQTQW